MFERGQSFNVYIGHQAYDAKPNQTLPICFSSLHQEVNQTEQRIIKLTLSVNSLQFMLFYTCLSFFNYVQYFLWIFSLIFCIQLLRSKRPTEPTLS